MSVTEAAKNLDVSRTTLSRLLNGHTSLSLEMAARLAKFFNTRIEIWINVQAQYAIGLMSKQLNKIR
jgi:addiction module HigA family antidote